MTRRPRPLPTLLLVFALFALPACTVAPQANIQAEVATQSQDASPAPLAEGTSSRLDIAIDNTSTSNCPGVDGYNGVVLEALGVNLTECPPSDVPQNIGIYIYDLNANAELVSINADQPFQFASAFKGPLLLYFLSNCQKYWDTASPEWNSYFLDQTAAGHVDQYTSSEYHQALASFINQPSNWADIETFLSENRATVDGGAVPSDSRYSILAPVFIMVTRSDNAAAGVILKFVFDYCLAPQPEEIDADCGGPNAITAFNRWFNSFSKIDYAAGEPRRGLHAWDSLAVTAEDGTMTEMGLATYGLSDACVNQPVITADETSLNNVNTWTARDLFLFYRSLYHMQESPTRATALDILAVDQNTLSRGYLKNMARRTDAISMSKNGAYGLILGDAGILVSQGRAYIIVTLSYNAMGAMDLLYGQYDLDGNAVGGTNGLIADLLEGGLSTYQSTVSH